MITLAFQRGPIDGLMITLDVDTITSPKLVYTTRCGEQDPGVYELDDSAGNDVHVGHWRALEHR